MFRHHIFGDVSLLWVHNKRRSYQTADDIPGTKRTLNKPRYIYGLERQ